MLLPAAALLLVTMGGAVVAAPLTLPLLVVVGRRATGRTVRFLAAAVAGLTAAEATWALVYVAVGESQPWIWAVPLVAAIVTVGAIVRRAVTA